MQKKILNIVLIFLLVNIMTGCNIMPEIVPEKTTEKTITNPTNYKYIPANSRFKIVSVEHINNDSINGEDILVLVDKKTKVMYIQAQIYQCGYGLSLEVLRDKDGKPLLFEGVLD